MGLEITAASPLSDDILKQLAMTLEQRKSADSGKSYVAALYAGGDDSILKKIGEEATEVILAAKGSNSGDYDSTHLVREMADLWFHSLVLLAHKDLHPDKVLQELETRFGQSGLTEKAARNIEG